MLVTARKTTRLLVVVVFGLILPFALIWMFLVSHYRLQREDILLRSFDNLSQSLDGLEKYHEDKVFLHALFQKNFALADESSRPLMHLQKKLTAFRKVFPGQLKFIVWNKNGDIDDELTDEKRFQYVLKTMYAVLHNLKRQFEAGNITDPSSLSSVNAKMNLLRGYFGEFLFARFLFLPLKPAYFGKCLFVSEYAQKRLLWYYPGQNFSLACFVNNAPLGKQIGPRMIISRFNAKNDLVRLAFIDPVSYDGFGLPKNLTEVAEIKIEALKFSRYAVASRESDKFLLHFRQISPDLIMLSYQSRHGLFDPYSAAALLLVSIGKWLVVAVFILFCLRMRHRNFSLSIRQKMLLLFLFANGLPVLILLSVGYEFFNEKKKDLIDAAHQESLRVLRELDARFPEVSHSLARHLNTFIEQKNMLYGQNKWPQSEIEALKKTIEEISPGDSMLYEADGKMLFHQSAAPDISEKLFGDLFQRALDFFNAELPPQTQLKKRTVLDQVASNDMLLHDFIWYSGRFATLVSGASEHFTYLKFLGNPGGGKIWGLLSVSWDPAAFLRTFIVGKLKENARHVAPYQIAVMDKSSEQIFSLTSMKNPLVKRLMRQTMSRKMVTHEDIELDGQKFLFTSISGNVISGAILAAFYPQKIIDEGIRELQYTILLVGIAILLVLMKIVNLFSNRLLLPLQTLTAGITHMRCHDFNYQADYRSNDEFGDLIKVFNQTLLEMKKLAVGTAVQVSLLPPERYRKHRVNLFARSLFMSKMGGDYFDYFDISDDRIGIFFGDVAGHGIPAAMVMAMVKAVVSSSAEDFKGPAAVLERANSILNELKKRNWRRMMTCQCFDLNCKTGEFVFSNAGHCYPVLISADGTLTMLELNGMPVGATNRKGYQEISGCLHPGDTLILYTDGIIEALNASGEVFDYTGFRGLLQTARSTDLEKYWNNIYAGYCTWACAQDDDLTFLLLRMEEDDG
ncbi:MAG: hypothetical protein EOM80_07265 [Erysipelotrichia bacterium]|nr:hypothetical protein [Erysipelotrichia bacterium]